MKSPTVKSPAGVRRELIATLTKRVATDAEFRRRFREAPREACDAIGVPFEFVRHMLADDHTLGQPTRTSSSSRSTV
jgi:hypothetical protein